MIKRNSEGQQRQQFKYKWSILYLIIFYVASCIDRGYISAIAHCIDLFLFLNLAQHVYVTSHNMFAVCNAETIICRCCNVG
jgi:hypothetical protein